MVHALHEMERILAPRGLLLDLRPLLDRWPLEVAWSNGFREAGRATDLAEPLADDMAADAAFAEHAPSVRLVREQRDEFPLFYYWDTPKEMQGYIADEWSDVIAVDERVWAGLRTAWATANPDARVRMRMKMQITRYRK
jgi:hypothetical protein